MGPPQACRRRRTHHRPNWTRNGGLRHRSPRQKLLLPLAPCVSTSCYLFVIVLSFFGFCLLFFVIWSFPFLSHHGSVNTTHSSLTCTFTVTGRLSRAPNTDVATSPVHTWQWISWIMARSSSTWTTSWCPDLCLLKIHPRSDAPT